MGWRQYWPVRLQESALDEGRRARRTGRIVMIGAVFAAVAVGFDVLTYFYTGAWQMLAAAAGVLLASLCLLPAGRLIRRGQLDAAGFWILFGLLAACGTAELVWRGAGPAYTAAGILLIFLVGLVVLPGKRVAWLAAAGLYGILVFLVTKFDRLPRYDVAQSPALCIFVLGITASWALVLLSQIVPAFRPVTIRSRLFATVVLAALLPAIAFGAVSSAVGFPSGRQQVINQLRSVATLKEAELNTWASSLQADLAATVIGDETIGYMREVLSPLSDPVDHQVASDQLHQRLGQMVEGNERLDELFLMDLDRRVVLSTDPRWEGLYGGPGSPVYFQKGLKGEYLYPPSYSLSIGGIAVVAVRPILDEGGNVLGILAGRAGMATLSQIMLERSGLGETGETYLLTRIQVMLTEPRSLNRPLSGSDYVFTAAAYAATQEHTSGYGWYDNYAGDRVIGVFRWLPELQVALLAEQSEAEALGAVYTTLGIQMGVATAVVLGAGLVSLILAQGIVTPLADLVRTAMRVSAGDLQQAVVVEREDEIGLLAGAFNSMTTQLRELISSLEERVKERTGALRRRALQLETSMRVSRDLTASIEDIDDSPEKRWECAPQTHAVGV